MSVQAPDVVHATGWCSQPEVNLKCQDASGTPAWKGQEKWPSLPPNVYELDADRDGEERRFLYTFLDELVTCPECRRK